MIQLMSMKVGELVRSSEKDLGIGKIIAIETNSIKIEYFSSMGVRIIQQVQPENIQRVKLENANSLLSL